VSPIDSKKKTGKVIIDAETGQIEHEIEFGDRFIKAKSVESYLRNQKNKDAGAKVCIDWRLPDFNFQNSPELKLVLPELSQNEKSFLLCISVYISYEDCHLQFTNGFDIGTEDLVKITGFSRSVVYELVESLIKKDIIYKGKNSVTRQYFVNPWLFHKGNRVNKVLKTMFKNYRIRTLDNKKWKDLKD
jgi:hypothetical protein